MYTRRRMAARERAARSRLAQLLHEYEPLVRGSLVVMSRTCGKPTCRCARGEKHSSLYLSVKEGRKRRMIYIPPAVEESVRAAVGVFKETSRLVDEISASCLDRFLAEKAKELEVRGKGAKR